MQESVSQNELKSTSWIFIFYISKMSWDSLRLTQFMAENKSRIEKIAGLQHSANATNDVPYGQKHYLGTVGFQHRL